MWFTADKLLSKMGASFPKLRLQLLQQAIAVSQPTLYNLGFVFRVFSHLSSRQLSMICCFPASNFRIWDCRTSFLCCSGERYKDRFCRSVFWRFWILVLFIELDHLICITMYVIFSFTDWLIDWLIWVCILRSTLVVEIRFYRVSSPVLTSLPPWRYNFSFAKLYICICLVPLECVIDV